MVERQLYLAAHDGRKARESGPPGLGAGEPLALSGDDGIIFNNDAMQREVGNRVRDRTLRTLIRGDAESGEELAALRDRMLRAFRQGAQSSGYGESEEGSSGATVLHPPSRAMLAQAILEILSHESGPSSGAGAATGGAAAVPVASAAGSNGSSDRSFGTLASGFLGWHTHMQAFFPLIDTPGLRPPTPFLLSYERMFQGARLMPLVTRFADSRALTEYHADTGTGELLREKFGSETPDDSYFSGVGSGGSTSKSRSGGSTSRFARKRLAKSRPTKKLTRYDLKRSDVLIGVEKRQKLLSRCVEAFLDPLEFDVPAVIEPPIGFAQKLERMLHEWRDIVGDDETMRGYASEALRDARTAARDVILLAVADAQSSRDSSLQRRMRAARERQRGLQEQQQASSGAAESKSADGGEGTADGDDVLGGDAAVEYAAARIVGFDGELVSQQEVTQEREQEKQQEKEQEVLQELVTAPRDRDACRFPKQWALADLTLPVDFDEEHMSDRSITGLSDAARVAAAAAFDVSPLHRHKLVEGMSLAEY